MSVRCTYEPDAGEIRSLYGIPAEQLFRVNDDITRQAIDQLYPLWIWAHVTGDWSRIEGDWKHLLELVAESPNKMEEDCRKGSNSSQAC